METTTIEISGKQKQALDELKAQGQPYKHIVQELIEHYNQNNESSGLAESRMREIAQEEINAMVVLEALE